MNKSETIANLAQALSKAQGQMGSAKKDADNPYFKSKYADLASVVDAIKEPLSKNGLAYSQLPFVDEHGVHVETILMHLSGEWVSSKLTMRPVKTDPQGVGSTLTYARRYGLQSMVGIAADDDDDGNLGSGNLGKAPPKPPPKTKPRQDHEQPPPAHEPEDDIDHNELARWDVALVSCDTLEHLAKVWRDMPKEFHPRLVAAKDKQKAAIAAKEGEEVPI